MGHIALIGEMRNTYKILIRKTKGKRPFGDVGEDRRMIFLDFGLKLVYSLKQITELYATEM
jgi:hypothetical protein